MKREDNRGLTLVELVCTIAILSIVATAVGGVMVASAKNYQKGTTEIELQQEAQITVNQIGDLVIDATLQVSFSGTPGGDGILAIRQDSTLYEVSFQATAKEIRYAEYVVDNTGAVTNTVVSNELMTENVTLFEADATQFADSGILKLKLALEKNNRTYASDFTITSRNGGRTITTTEAAATISAETEIVLEPNQDYPLTATVTGPADTGVNWVLSGNTETGTYINVTPTGTYLHIDNDERASTLTLLAQSNAKREDGVTPLAQKTVTVHVRRVTMVELNVTLESGTAFRAGAIYRIDATVSGTNLDKFTGVSSDNDYIDPRKVTWDHVYSVNGNEVGGPYHNWESPSDYYTAYDVTDTSMRIKLNRDYYDSSHLIVTAVAKHPEGENKVTALTGVTTPYDHVFDIYVFSRPYYTYDDSMIYRGTDNAQGSIALDSIKAAIQASGGLEALNAWSGQKVARYYRFREITSVDPVTGARSYGPWTGWTRSQAEAGMTINLRPAETYRFDLDKDYELQIKFYAYKNDVTNILWPLADTPEESYTIDAEIHRTVMKFKIAPFGYTMVRSLGTEAAPQDISVGQEIKFALEIETPAVWGYDFTKNNNGLMFRVQKLVDGAWVDADAADYTADVKAHIYHESKFTFHAPGTYRVEAGYAGVPHTIYNYLTKEYVYDTRNYWLGNEANGDDFFYFSVN